MTARIYLSLSRACWCPVYRLMGVGNETSIRRFKTAATDRQYKDRASKCAKTKAGLGVACTKVNASLLNDS